MKFAIVNERRQEAQPNLSGECPGCSGPMVAKCGEVRIWHWAHQGKRLCDPWWENETEWHRTWKEQFPDEWQEIVHHAENGTRHIADVKTERGWAIEFQHSRIESEERSSRNAFYPKLVWVVDGTRRKRDEKQFIEALNAGTQLHATFPIKQIRSDECALLREWVGSYAPIFFDFGSEQALSWLIAGRPDGRAYVGPISRASFVAMHRGGVTRDFDELVKDFTGLVADYETYMQRAYLRSARSLQLGQMDRRRRRL